MNRFVIRISFQTARPMFGKIESHTQKTLSLIRDTFFKKEAKSKKDSLFLIQDTVFESEAKNEDESNKKSVSAEKEKEKFNMMSDRYEFYLRFVIAMMFFVHYLGHSKFLWSVMLIY